MCRIDAETSHNSAALEKSKSTRKPTHGLSAKLRSVFKSASKATGVSATLKDSSSGERAIQTLPCQRSLDVQRDSQPSDVSAASERSRKAQMYALESLSKLIAEVNGDPKLSDVSTASKVRRNTMWPIRGSLTKLFSNFRRRRSNVEYPLRCPPKPPIIRGRASQVFPVSPSVAGEAQYSLFMEKTLVFFELLALP